MAQCVVDLMWDASALVAWQRRKVLLEWWTSSCFISKSMAALKRWQQVQRSADAVVLARNKETCLASDRKASTFSEA